VALCNVCTIRRACRPLQILRRLEAVVAAESVPTSDPDLRFMTRLLQLAIASKQQLRERRCSPERDRLRPRAMHMCLLPAERHPAVV